MLFDPKALHNKTLFLDAVLQKPGIQEKVISRHLQGSFQCVRLPRVWEPGGGATLFRVESSQGPLLLKVKHQSVHVESLLESEPVYMGKPSLQNEHDFLCLLSNEHFARVVFYDEEESFQFLAVEWLEPFFVAIQTMTAVQLLDAWYKIVEAVKILYSMGIVHTDIHEHNVCFRDCTPVLVDFEEARFLWQDLDFEDSLDVVGVNKFGSVGEFPAVDGSINGLTCLQRLRQVFKSLIRKQLPKLIAEANFDNSCPCNLDEFQEPDPRVYQSLDFPGFDVVGQRPKRDLRQLFFNYFLCRAAQQEKMISHVDLGSNLGAFCFQAAGYPFVHASSGLESFQKYVGVANIMAFLYDVSKTRFVTFICGEDSFGNDLKGTNFVTMFSVYHHIAKKDNLLKELNELGAKYLLAEFATQDRYYAERGSLLRELQYIQSITGYGKCHLLALSKDYQRPIVLFTNQSLTFFDRIFVRIVNSRLGSIGWAVLFFVRLITISSMKDKRDG
jgi:hypothetical protein